MSAIMRNEINQFKAIVYELNLSPSALQTHIKDEGQFNIVAHVFTHVKFPQSAQKNFKTLIHLHNGKPIKNQRKLEMHSDGNIYYNTLAKDDVNTLQALAHNNSEAIIIATEAMALKYKVVYEYTPSTIGNAKLEDLKIKALNLTPLSPEDEELINKAN